MEFENAVFSDGDHPTHVYVAGIIVAALAFLVAVKRGFTPGNVM